jgi:hypothetical protein
MTPRTWLLLLFLCAPAAPLAFDDGADGSSFPAPGPAPEHGKASTADASPVDRGAFEVEFTYAPTWNDGGGSRGFDAAADGYSHGFTGTLTYGVAPDVDVRVSTGFATIYDAAGGGAGASPNRGSGASDLAVGARWRFVNLPPRALELALTLDAVLPTGSRATSDQLGVSQEFWSARAALVGTKDLGAITANGEVAWTVPVAGNAGGLRSVAQVNGAIGWQVARWLQPELELNYQATLGPGAQVLAVTAGVVAPFAGGHRVVLAVQHGVWGQHAPETTGAAFAFKTAL